jgi:hypothetical protein
MRRKMKIRKTRLSPRHSNLRMRWSVNQGYGIKILMCGCHQKPLVGPPATSWLTTSLLKTFLISRRFSSVYSTSSIIFSLLFIFRKYQSRLMRIPCCVSILINCWMAEPILMKPCTYIITHKPISTAYFINPSHQPVSIRASTSRRSSVRPFKCLNCRCNVNYSCFGMICCPEPVLTET